MKSIKGLVLLIDDSEANNVLNTRLINKYLGNCKNVQTVLNGQLGIDYLLGVGEFADRKKFPMPSLILLDINMPVMNGFEFIEEFNKYKNNFTTIPKIVMLTSSIIDADKTKAEDLGVINFITKPLTKQVLENMKLL